MSELGYKIEQQPNVKAEMEAQEWYDLLPVEKKLIKYSLSLGIVLLVVFIFVFKFM
ncbi:hypothetical protein [Desulfotruncus alcoholivorax]|uniref:hypothetical protein n=1 Tax=Desulfotruncus alcoholivorax TaxID=265477 RepID=UPI00041BDF56|nr:hypothetical protein [Desulfotruncus alcoholivorax]